jgi:formate/nitrite transporter FocA (FNT family)
MHAMNPTSRYHLSTANPFGTLAALVIANLVIALSFYVRIPIWMDLRPLIVPVLSMASVLLFSLSMIIVVSLATRIPKSPLMTTLAIANGILAVCQQSVFLSSWLT